MAERFKHDSTIPRVKITRQDLLASLETTNNPPKQGDRNISTPSPNMAPRPKSGKYGAQPYKPGEGLLRKGQAKVDNENSAENSPNSPQIERKTRNKRPDMPLYQPKRGGGGRNSLDSKMEESPVVDNHEKKEKFKGGVSNKCRDALIQRPACEVAKKVESSNLVNSCSQNSVFRGENGEMDGKRTERRGRPNRTRSMCSRSEDERWEEALEKKMENGLKISHEDNNSRSWADEMERQDEQLKREKTQPPARNPRAERRQPDDRPNPNKNRPKNHEKRANHPKILPNHLTNGNPAAPDRNSPDGKASPAARHPLPDETDDTEHLNSDQSSLFEMADVESCSSPPKSAKRKTKKKKRRPKSESSTDEKSPAKNAERRDKNCASSTSKGGGILHLPTGRPPSAPMMHSERGNNPTMVFTGNLYNPNNPAQPRAVYRPIQGDQRMRSDEYAHDGPGHAAMGSGYGEHARGAGGGYGYGYQGAGYAQSHPEPMNWRPARGPDGVSMNPAKSGCINKNMIEVMQIEQEIGRVLSMAFDKMDLKALNCSRFAAQMRYEATILQDIEYSAEVNIEQMLWKSVFYQVIEAFRKQMLECPNFKERIKQTMLQIIEEAVLFYENLLEKLQEKYGFHLPTFLDSEAVRPKMQILVKKALMSAQKMIISLGDLARYKELANDTANYKKAKNLYMKAQQLAPKNGRPYNQLAILALYERRKLDAVYHYMRSLLASNPFLSAKEGLNQVFDEAKKKYEQVEKRRQECQNAKVVKEKKKGGPEREEVWVLPDGGLAVNSENSDDDSYDDLSKLSTVDLNKKFILSFLHAHGRLLTKIEMESFSKIAGQLLREFTCLLRKSPLPLNSTRLVQLLAINMYTVELTEGQNVDPECQALHQVYALQLSFEMFRLLVECATAQLRKHWTDELTSNIHEDLNHLLPAIKVWCDWLICNESLWNRPRPVQITEFRNSADVDPWTLLAEFFSLAKKMDVRHIGISREKKNGDWEPVTLPEDITLAGFEPLLNLPQESAYVPRHTDKELARNGFRFSRFVYTADYLCGISTQVLEYDVRDKLFKLHVVDKYKESGNEDGKVNGIQQQQSLSQEEDGVCGDNSETTKVVTGSGSSEIEKLKSRKEELTRKKADQERHQQEVQAVLSDTNAVRKRFEIRPDYIIADTNCFIDHLEGIKKLVATDHFRLQVPLVVVNELDGLSKGCDVIRDDQHNAKVVSGAKEALEYLNNIFGPPCHPKVRSVTAQGNVLRTLQFTSENFGQNRDCNDDIILDCCKTLCKDEGVIKDNVQHFNREAVLLTDDRALRVKAVNADVPTRDIQRFLLLMRIS